MYFSLNIIGTIKSRRTRWAGDVASTVQEKGVYRALVGKLEGKRELGRLRS
jgi:hypothetical protein